LEIRARSEERRAGSEDEEQKAKSGFAKKNFLQKNIFRSVPSALFPQNKSEKRRAESGKRERRAKSGFAKKNFLRKNISLCSLEIRAKSEKRRAKSGLKYN